MTTNTLKISDYYSKIGHKHDDEYAKKDVVTYSILLSKEANVTTINSKRFEMVRNTSNRKIYASVKQNGTIVTGGFVVFIANGTPYTKQIGAEISNYATLDINWNELGTYNIYAVYIGNPSGVTHNSTKTSYSYCMDYCLLDIVSEYKLTTTNLTTTFGTTGTFTATLTQRDTNNALTNKPIIFTINGVSYVRVTNTSGTAQLNINLPPGTYPITTTYEYEINDTVRKIENTNTIIVNTNYILSTNDLISKIGSTDGSNIFEAELIKKDGTPVNGKTIYFTINGVTYPRDTNANGKASLTINLADPDHPNGKPGTYPISTVCNITENNKSYTLRNNNTVIRYEA